MFNNSTNTKHKIHNTQYNEYNKYERVATKRIEQNPIVSTLATTSTHRHRLCKGQRPPWNRKIKFKIKLNFSNCHSSEVLLLIPKRDGGQRVVGGEKGLCSLFNVVYSSSKANLVFKQNLLVFNRKCLDIQPILEYPAGRGLECFAPYLNIYLCIIQICVWGRVTNLPKMVYEHLL